MNDSSKDRRLKKSHNKLFVCFNWDDKPMILITAIFSLIDIFSLKGASLPFKIRFFQEFSQWIKGNHFEGVQVQSLLVTIIQV